MTQWVKFWLLALIWGSSFLLIKVAVDDLGAFPLVSIRIGLAALIFSVYFWATGRKFPHKRSEQLALIFVGIFNTAVPFTLISWGETRIDSGLATMMNATVPLFNLIIAHFVLADERLNAYKTLGLIIGFLGIIILVSGNIGSQNSLEGQLAVVIGSISYAVSIIVIRMYLQELDPFTTAGGSLIVGAIAIISTTLVVTRPLPDFASLEAEVILASVVLGVVNTVIAYFLFYDLIRQWGVRASLVTYAMPPIGITLGYFVLDEKVDWRLLVGGALVLTGIVLAKINNNTAFGFSILTGRLRNLLRSSS